MEYLRTALQSILADKARAFLTMLGIIIGVAAVIVMVSLGNGTAVSIQDRIQSLGSNLLTVMPGSSSKGGVRGGMGSFNTLTFDDVKAIRTDAEYVKAVSALIRVDGQVVGGGSNWSTRVEGVEPSYLEIRNWEIEEGEAFTEDQDRARSKVCLIGSVIVEELFEDQDPIGAKIRIGSVPVTIIGVLKEKGGSQFGMSVDDIILVPAQTAYYRLSGSRNINEIYMSGVSTETLDYAEDEVVAILREEHKLSSTEDDDFDIRNQNDLIEMTSDNSRTFTMLLAGIAAVSLIVGGIGIMNIMLVSVTERTREIGVRRAVGARYKDILIQFLTEAVALCLLGGIIGVFLAFIVAEGMNQWTDSTVVFSPSMSLISFGFAGAVGVFFGFYPAHRAASLPPIDALRHE